MVKINEIVAINQTSLSIPLKLICVAKIDKNKLLANKNGG